MKTLFYLTRRSIKLFLRDRGMFLASMITPIILLVLYASFLGGIYSDNFTANVPESFAALVPQKLINGFVCGQLCSSLLAVSCITVAFSSNMIMVQDKVSGALRDLLVTPVKRHIIAISYYIATFFTTIIICYITLGASFAYLRCKGWYLSANDVLLCLLDVLLLAMFGTALSSIVSFALSTQGQMSVACTIISAGYGFICGAYMPISSFGEGLQRVLSFLPGTYGTSLVRQHMLGGVFREMESIGFPPEVCDAFRKATDCSIYFQGVQVSSGAMYALLCGSIALLIIIYIILNAVCPDNKK